MDINKDEFKKLLKSKYVRVNFEKKDGSKRSMLCTLKQDVVPPYEKKTSRLKKQNEEALAVWDVEKEAFRSFRLGSVVEYYEVIEGYEL